MRKYLIVVKINLSKALIYRSVIVGWTIVSIISVASAYFIWNSAASATGSFGEMTRGQIQAYYALFVVLSWIYASYAQFSIIEEIDSGELSNFLLKPFSYFVYKLAQEHGWRIGDLTIRLPIAILFIFFFRSIFFPSFTLSLFFLVILSIILGATIYYCISFTFGLIAFWASNVYSLMGFYWIAIGFLGGEYIPLPLLPSFLFRISMFLPFRYIYSFPIEIYFGLVSGSNLIFGFGVQFLWLISVIFLAKKIWQRGVKRYNAYSQ